MLRNSVASNAKQLFDEWSWTSTLLMIWYVFLLLDRKYLHSIVLSQISQLEVEIQGIPASIRPQYTSRAKEAKADLQRCKKLARDCVVKRDDKLVDQYNVSSDRPYDEANERTRLLTGHERLNDASQRLQNSTRLALETEDAGADILRALLVQREQIENARGTLNTADTSIDRASGTIQKMIRQMYKQRFIIGILVIVLIIVIVVILYFKLIRH
ncbi:t-SNARE VTI1, variant 2 [Stygiomarasmius scandens]|uniref:t-SNARE VTI1, variant 2 n=1 Tax=Marasmiellus scandens TaxID=2682957 RepID=A0ABR1J1S6_9AGAR